jgi:hypothetical protein
MEWINYMATIQKQGGAVDVSAMMTAVAGPPQAAAASPAGITGLLAGLKARRFRA